MWYKSLMTARISLIAALGANTLAIGKENALLWRIPQDLERFKALTMNHPIIMGSKTYASIGKPLPGRTNIVVSDDSTYALDGVRVCHSIDDALKTASELDDEEVFVIGGGSIYTQTIDIADRLYLTLVDSIEEGDVFFPAYEHLSWKEVERTPGHHGDLSYEFVTLDRER
jgi:dihydrofolate reductase